jgi:hypothetical protein
VTAAEVLCDEEEKRQLELHHAAPAVDPMVSMSMMMLAQNVASAASSAAASSPAVARPSPSSSSPSAIAELPQSSSQPAFVPYAGLSHRIAMNPASTGMQSQPGAAAGSNYQDHSGDSLD